MCKEQILVSISLSTISTLLLFCSTAHFLCSCTYRCFFEKCIEDILLLSLGMGCKRHVINCNKATLPMIENIFCKGVPSLLTTYDGILTTLNNDGIVTTQ